MADPIIKHIFAAANSPGGCVFATDGLLGRSNHQLITLSGGSRTMRSSLMRQTGMRLVVHGFDIEQLHCTNNPRQLDGLAVPSIGTVVIDSCASNHYDFQLLASPHQTLDVGNGHPDTSPLPDPDAIAACQKATQFYHNRAFRLLAAAKSVYDNQKAIHRNAMDFTIANQQIQLVQDSILTSICDSGTGRINRWFASAITPNGPINYLASLFHMLPHRYLLTGSPGTGKSTLIRRMIKAAVSKGLDIEVYCCPLDPQKPEHLIIPALGVGVITSVPPHTYSEYGATMIIDMNQCLKTDQLDSYQEMLEYDRHTFWDLFHKAIMEMHKVQQLQDEIEGSTALETDFSQSDILLDQMFISRLTVDQQLTVR